MIDTKTPPMGWNSWNVYLGSPDEEEMKAQMRSMAADLLPYGYQYFTTDAHWYGFSNTQYKDGTIFAWDEYGRPIPQPNKYPSSADGSGFKAMADYAHSLGLKFGLHMMRGLNKWMLGHGCCIKGTETKLEEIIDWNSPCHWDDKNGWYGVKLDHPDVQKWYDSLFENFASWGVDFIKYDDIAYPLQVIETEMIHNALEKCGRKMVLSLSPGEANVKDGEFYSAHANMWRISGDFWDDWQDCLRKSFDYLAAWNERIEYPGWPDADMIPIGWLCEKKSSRGLRPRFCRFNQEEIQSLFTLFCIARSPLILTSNLLRDEADVLHVITQPDCLAVNQRGKHPLCLKQDGDLHIWRSAADGNEYLALFNLSEAEQTFEVDIPQEFEGKTALDVWNKEIYQLCHATSTFPITAHGVVFLRIK